MVGQRLDKAFMDVQIVPRRPKINMIKEEYIFQNIYIITTYRCNLNCAFCLFKFNHEKECTISKVIDQLIYSIKNSPKKVYIKITGGEPFLKIRLLKRILDVCEKYKNKIFAIGIGTNGTIKIPKFFNNTNIRIDIFFSRHSINNLDTKKLYTKINNHKITYRFNCNLIRGKIDSLRKIKQYLEKVRKINNFSVCFRELNKISLEKNLLYPDYVYDYEKYYAKNIVIVKDLLSEIKRDKDFVITKINGNYYDENVWMTYKNTTWVKFRIIDEVKLIEYNDNYPHVIDEYVIHPDGTLTGCWDKERKLLRR